VFDSRLLSAGQGEVVDLVNDMMMMMMMVFRTHQKAFLMLNLCSTVIADIAFWRQKWEELVRKEGCEVHYVVNLCI
jgi:hypothetical protein